MERYQRGTGSFLRESEVRGYAPTVGGLSPRWREHLRDPERGLNGDYGLGVFTHGLEAERSKAFSPVVTGLKGHGLQQPVELGLQRAGPYVSPGDLYSKNQGSTLYQGGSGLHQQQGETFNRLGPGVLQQGDLRLHKGRAYPIDGLSAREQGPNLRQEFVRHSLQPEKGYTTSLSPRFNSLGRSRSPIPNLSSERSPYVSLPRDLSHPGLAREPLSYLDLIRERTTDLGRDRSSYLEVSRERVVYSNLSGERLLYPELPSDRSSYHDLSTEQLSYPGMSRERSPPLNQPMDLSTYLRLTGGPSDYPPQPREQSSNTGAKYSGGLSPYAFLSKTSSPAAFLNQDQSFVGTKYDRSRSPHSSLSVFRKSRSRSPLVTKIVTREQSSTRGSGRDRSRSPYRPRSRSRTVQSKEKSMHHQETRQSKEKPTETQTGRGSAIRVDGFPSHYKWQDIKGGLLREFEKYGAVTDVEQQKAPGGISALIYFSQQDAAEVALREAVKKPLFSKILTLSPWVVLIGDKDRPISLAATRVMYLENLDKSVSFETLYKACEPYGDILDIEVKDIPGSRFNSAIVQYWEAKDAKIAARALDLEKIGKCVIKTTSGKNKVSNCVWADGLPKDLEESKLLKHFKKSGSVQKYVFDRKRGSALILYKAVLPARQCVRSMENGKTNLGGKYVTVDYANDRAQLAFCQAMERSGQDIGSFLFA